MSFNEEFVRKLVSAAEKRHEKLMGKLSLRHDEVVGIAEKG